jgi:N-acetylglucosamine kinase-like BadF-type ATPase
MSHVLGVDAGNTKTIALVARLDGTISGTGRGGCGDIYEADSTEPALATVENAVTHALNEAGIGIEDLVAGGFSMAGADWPEDYEFLRTEMRRRGFGKRVIVVNDAVGALRAGSPDGVGVSIVCGTFVAIGARAPDGSTWHHSWWLQSGGARELGTRALQAVYRAELGIDSPTALTEKVLNFFAQRRVEDVLHMLTARDAKKSVDIGKLARVLLDAAEDGDAVAKRVVQEHGAMLGDYALAAARRVGIERSSLTLVLAGGVFRHPSRTHIDSIVARMCEKTPKVQSIHSRFEPSVGALFLALEEIGITIDKHLLEHLTGSLPPDVLFAT